jgi:formate hydrogenlyase subunit 4
MSFYLTKVFYVFVSVLILLAYGLLNRGIVAKIGARVGGRIGQRFYQPYIWRSG